MLKILMKIIPVVGSIILFCSWVFQQTLVDEANGILRNIDYAEGVYQTYQSTNALFNAITETVKGNDESVKAIRRSQLYNYELGLRDMEMLLDDNARKTIRPPPDVFGGTQEVAAMMTITQDRLEKIQGALALKKREVIGRKAELNRIFVALYALGSVAILFGSVLNALATSRTAKAHPSTGEG